MSVNAASGTSLRQDLVGALRQARAASAQQIDASAFSTLSQGAGATQGTANASQAKGAASTPALSSDLMSSLLQLQSDFSQMGLQTGVTSAADPDDASGHGASSGSIDASQAASAATAVHHHRGHRAGSPEADGAGETQTGSSAGATDATAASDGSTAGPSLGDGLQNLLQQMTKAIAAYATGGPVGVAAAALTSPSKA